jgi:hypothetical protein
MNIFVEFIRDVSICAKVTKREPVGTEFIKTIDFGTQATIQTTVT